jgi:phosphate transport system protein
MRKEELRLPNVIGSKQHVESRFIKELDQLKMIILEMAALAEKAMDKAVRAFFERDMELAEEVIKGDQEINLLEVEADRQSLRLLALDQPLARDLRFIVGCMRISVDLERIADLAAGIARRAIFLSSRPPLPYNPALEQLAETAMDMLRTVIDAFVKQSVERARDVCQMDDTADELNVAVLKSLLDYMVKEVPAVERSVQTIITARYLERVADQVTNIAESVVFIVQGVNIKHHCEG